MFQELTPGQRFFFVTAQSLDAQQEERRAYTPEPSRGELHLMAEEVSETYAGFRVISYSFAADLILENEEDGPRRFIFEGRSGQGTATLENDIWELAIEFAGGTVFDRDDRENVYSVFEEGSYAIGQMYDETEGSLQISFADTGSMSGERVPLEIINASGSLVPTGGWFGEKSRISIHTQYAAVQTYTQADAETIPHRRLIVRPYLIYSEEEQIDALKERWDSLRKNAQVMWGEKGCIHVEDHPDGYTIKSVAALVEETQQPDLINALIAWNDSGAQGLPCFLVHDTVYGDDGGGHAQTLTHRGKLIVRKIVLSQGATNKLLLAHEVGHALGGLHFGDGETSVKWEGDEKTILDPSSDLHIENPPHNSEANCQNAYSSLLVTSAASDCIPQYDW